MKQTNSHLTIDDTESASVSDESTGTVALFIGGNMQTIEQTFGIGCNLHKVTLAMIELDEDALLDENGETVSELEQTLNDETKCVEVTK